MNQVSPDDALLMGIPVVLPEGMAPFRPYEGSIQVHADCCGRLIWQGPKQQEFKQQNPDVPIFCAICAAVMCHAQGVQPTVKCLREEG